MQSLRIIFMCLFALSMWAAPAHAAPAVSCSAELVCGAADSGDSGNPQVPTGDRGVVHCHSSCHAPQADLTAPLSGEMVIFPTIAPDSNDLEAFRPMSGSDPALRPPIA